MILESAYELVDPLAPGPACTLGHGSVLGCGLWLLPARHASVPVLSYAFHACDELLRGVRAGERAVGSRRRFGVRLICLISACALAAVFVRPALVDKAARSGHIETEKPKPFFLLS